MAVLGLAASGIIGIMLILGAMAAAGITIAVLSGTGVIFRSSTTTYNSRYQRFLTNTVSSGPVNSVKFSPNRLYLASGDDADNALIFTISGTGSSTTLTLNQTLSTHTDDVDDVAFSSDSTLLATASADNTVRIWNVATGVSLHTLSESSTNDVNSVSFSSSNLLAAGADLLRIYTVTAAAAILLFTSPSGGAAHNGAVNSVTFCASNPNILASGAQEAIIWDVTNGSSPVQLRKVNDFPSRLGSVSGLAFSSDCTVLAVAFGDLVASYETFTGILIVTVQPRDTVNYVAFDANDLLITAASTEVKLWNPINGNLVNTLSGSANSILGVDSLASGLIATGDASNEIILYNV